MGKKLKERLCWNCDGGVSFEAENCPYCAVYLSSMLPPLEEAEDSFVSPYASKEEEEEEVSVTASPYGSFQEASKKIDPLEQPLYNPLSEKETFIEEEEASTFGHPLLFLLPGMTFFLFGLALFLFENGKTLTLSWDKDLALPFLGGGALALLFGWRKIK